MKQKESKKGGRVRDVASAHPSALDVTTSTKSAGEKLKRLNTEKFPVAKGDKLVGRTNDLNPERSAARFGHDPESTTLGETGLSEAIYCYEDQSSDEAKKIMLENGLEHMPVVDRELRIVGIVSLKSLKTGEVPEPPKTKKRKAA